MEINMKIEIKKEFNILSRKQFDVMVEKLKREKSNEISNTGIEYIKEQIKKIFKECCIAAKIAFSVEEINEIINLILLTYIDLILENDKSTFESIFQYVRSIEPDNADIINEKTQKLKDGINNYKLNVSIYNQYAKMNDFLYSRGKYHTNHERDKKVFSTRVPHNLIKLEFAEAFSNGRLLIYELMYKNKNPFTTTHRDKNNILFSAYQNLCCYMDTICKCSNSKEIVSKSVFFWKFEKTYRFVFTSILAKYIFEQNIEVSTLKLPKLLCNYYFTYHFKDDNTSVFCDSPIISYYEEIIKYSFETKNTVLDVEILEIQREMMAYTLSILCVLFPPTETRSHKLFYNKETNKFDFEAVGDFLIKDCKIPVLLSEYKELIEKNINNNLYVKTIQELLLNNDVVEQKILSNSAKKMKGFKKIN